MANADRCVCCGEIIPEGTMACHNCLVVSKKQDKRLIDANALIAEYDRVHIGEPGKARKLMEDAPTVDAVEVVRCKDCQLSKYFEESGTRNCRTQGGLYRTVQDDDFCSYGERKDNDI